MPNAVPLDKIVQELDTLSLEQLLEVRERIDVLIKSKTAESANLVAYYPVLNSELRDNLGFVSQIGTGRAKYFATLVRDSKQHGYMIMLGSGADIQLDPPLEGMDAEDKTLEDAINLVEEWMSDDSGYDEETYPQIDAALSQDRLSL